MISEFSKFTILIPTLNEGEVIDSLIATLKELYSEIKIIVADDESTDDTQAKVKKIASSYQEGEIVLLERVGKVHGLTASVLDAILLVQTPYFIVMDGDFQHPPKVIAEMIEKISHDGVDIVAGARIPYKENQGIHRIIMTKLATFVAKKVLKLSGVSVSDPMSGFFSARTSLVKECIKNSSEKFEPRGYKVFFELLRALPKPLNVDQCFYQFAFREGGKSKLRPAHLVYFIKSLFK